MTTTQATCKQKTTTKRQTKQQHSHLKMEPKSGGTNRIVGLGRRAFRNIESVQIQTVWADIVQRQRRHCEEVLKCIKLCLMAQKSWVSVCAWLTDDWVFMASSKILPRLSHKNPKCVLILQQLSVISQQ